MKVKLDKLKEDKAQRAECELEMETLQASIRQQKIRAETSPLRAIKILHRYHFASALQRMSTVCDVLAAGEAKSGAEVAVR